MSTLDWETQTTGCQPRISGLGTCPVAEWPQAARDGVQQLRLECGNDIDFRRHMTFGVLEDKDLVRFLLARGGNVAAAAAMVREALVWRNRRMPYWLLVDPTSDASRALLKEARTGKLISMERDQFGRGICVMDSTVQNTVDGDSQMRYLAYCVELARSNCAEGVDKICVVMNFEDFSLFNTIPPRIVRETIEILTVVFPETLGACVVWQAPSYANPLFAMAKKFVDAKTMQKLTWVSGDAAPDSAADRTMVETIGSKWRELTGLGLPRTDKAYSEYFKREIACAKGFNFASYSRRLLANDTSRASRHGAPPWKLDWAEAIDEANWDGGWPNFWRANLIGRSQETKLSSECDFGDEVASECWETPPESESDLTEIDSPVHHTTETPVRTPPAIDSFPMFSLPSPVKPAVSNRDVGTEHGNKKCAKRQFLGLPSSLDDKSCLHGLMYRHRCRHAHLLFCFMAACAFAGISSIAVFARAQGLGITLPSSLRMLKAFIFLDIPLASVGLFYVWNHAQFSHHCRCLSWHCPWVPWGMLLLRLFLLMEEIKTILVPAVGSDEQFDIGAWTALGLIDMVLGVVFPLSWIQCLSRRLKKVVELRQELVASEV